MAQLAGKREVTLALIEGFCQLMKTEFNTNVTLPLAAIQEDDSFGTTVDNWKQTDIQTLCVILNVGTIIHADKISTLKRLWTYLSEPV